jgi:citrate synthase
MTEPRIVEPDSENTSAFGIRPISATADSSLTDHCPKSPKISLVEPTGLKAKISQLEKLLAAQADEMNAQRIEFEALKESKDKTELFYQDHLKEVRQTIIADMQQLQEDISRMVSDQKAENSRLISQINALRMEKSATQHQLLALQRRVFAIDDEIGVD